MGLYYRYSKMPIVKRCGPKNLRVQLFEDTKKLEFQRKALDRVKY